MFENLPRTRDEAKSAGVPRYFTGLPCRRGHLAPRQTTNGICVACRHPSKRVQSAFAFTVALRDPSDAAQVEAFVAFLNEIADTKAARLARSKISVD